MRTTVNTTKIISSEEVSKRFQKYTRCATEAHLRAQDETGRRDPGVRNPGNLELVYFLRAVKQLEDGNGDGGHSGWAIGLYKAVQNVGQHPTRIHTAEQLRSVHGVGEYMMKMVVEVLWRHYPPAKADLEEEQEEEMQQTAEATTFQASGRQGSRRGRGQGQRGAATTAAAALATGATALSVNDTPFGDALIVPVAVAEFDDGRTAGTVQRRGRGRSRGGSTGRNARRGCGGSKLRASQLEPDCGGVGSSSNGDDSDGAPTLPAVDLNPATHAFAVRVNGAAGASSIYGAHGGGLQPAGLGFSAAGVLGAADLRGVANTAPQRKLPRHGGENGYAPGPGTANYAFLIVMYMAWKREKRRQWDKDHLMAAAQACGLSDKDICEMKDLSARGNPANFYNSWSCFRQLISRDPPLASERTRSKGIRGKDFTLTNLGWALAARLYKHALRYREVEPLPGVTEEQVDDDIRQYCAVEEVEPQMQAYPAGTPKASRGRAYKGFCPGPRQDLSADVAAVAVAAVAGPAAAASCPSLSPRHAHPRKLQKIGAGAIDVGSLECILGSQASHAASQGLGSGLGLRQSIDDLAVPQGLIGSQSGATGGVSTTHSADTAAATAMVPVEPVAMTIPAPPINVHRCSRTAVGRGDGAWGVGQSARLAAATQATAVTSAANAATAARMSMPDISAAGPLPVAGATAAGSQAARLAGKPVTTCCVMDVVELLDSSDDDMMTEGGRHPSKLNEPIPHMQLQHSGLPQDFVRRGSGHATVATEATGDRSERTAGGSAAVTVGAAFTQGTAAAARGGLKTSRRQRVVVSDAHVEQLVEMGFNRAMARKALRRELGNLSSALDRLDEGTLSPADGEGDDSREVEDEECLESSEDWCPLQPLLGDLPEKGAGRGAVHLQLAQIGAEITAAAAGSRAAAADEPKASARPNSKASKKAVENTSLSLAVEVLHVPENHDESAPVDASQMRLLAAEQHRAGHIPEKLLGVGSLSYPQHDPMLGVLGLPNDDSQAAGGSQQLPCSLGSQQAFGTYSSQQSYRPASGSQQLNVLGTEQPAAGRSGSHGQDADAGEGLDERTLCSYEWLLPRVGEVAANHRELPIRLPPLQPEQQFEDVYDVVMLADNREPSNLVEALRAQASAQGVKVVAGVSLTVGDFLWVAARKGAPLSKAAQEQWFVLDAVLERKRMDDLLQSVRTKRYAQQKFRLLRSGLRRLYYLVEEPLEQFQGPEQKILRTSVQMGVLEGFILVQTTNMDDTARQLCMLTRAIERQCRSRTGPVASTAAVGPAGSAVDVSDDPLPKYIDWDTGLKNLKQDMKVQAMFGLMLCAVPGLGEERVKRILARYSTPAFLWESYKQAMREAAAAGRDPLLAAEQLLAGEVGSQCSARLYRLLFSKGVPPEMVVGS